MKSLYRSFVLFGVLCFSALLVTACSKSQDQDVKLINKTTRNITAYVVAGKVDGAQCTLYNTGNIVISGPITSVKGRVDFTKITGIANGDKVYITCVNGKYIDEATGTAKQLSSPIRGGSEIYNADTTIAVTPLTDLAIRTSLADLSDLVEGAKEVARAMGTSTNVDLLHTIPDDIYSTRSTGSAESEYGIMLALLSQLQKDGTMGSALNQLLDNLQAGLTVDKFDGPTVIKLQDSLGALRKNSVILNNLDSVLPQSIANNLGIMAPVNASITGVLKTSSAPPFYYGETIIFTGTGVNLDRVKNVVATNASCQQFILGSKNTVIVVTCTVANSGSSLNIQFQNSNGNAITGGAADYVILTPTVSEVYPLTATWGTQVKFTAKGFGLLTSGYKFTLGDTDCTNAESGNDRNTLIATCATPQRSGGATSQSLKISNYGVASTEKTFTINFADSSDPIITGKITTTPSAPLIYGKVFTFTAPGINLNKITSATLTNGGSCSTPSISTQHTEATVDCLVGTIGSESKFEFKSSSVVSGTISGGSEKFPTQATKLNAVTPSSANFNSDTVFTATGLGLDLKDYMVKLSSNGVVAGDCTNSAKGNTDTTISATCRIGNDRNISSPGILTFSNYGVNTPEYSINVVFNSPKITITSFNPSSILNGARGSSAWTIVGTGFYNSIPVLFNGSSCIGGTANTAGTQLINVDCSNITAPTSGSSTTLTVGGESLSNGISLTALPTPNYIWRAGRTSKTVGIGGTKVPFENDIISNNIPGCNSSVNYNISNKPSGGDLTVDSSSGVVTPSSTTGDYTINATSPAVNGVCAAGSAYYIVTVSSLPSQSVQFANPNTATVTYTGVGGGTYTNVANIVACPAGTAGTLTYTSSDATNAPVSSTGVVTYKKAGVYVIRADVASTSSCAASSNSYVLTVDKVTPTLSFNNPTTSVAPAGNVTNTVSFGNLASGDSANNAGGVVNYYSSDTSKVTVDVNTGNVTPLRGVSSGSVVIYAVYKNSDSYENVTGSATAQPNYTLTVKKFNQNIAWLTAPPQTLAVGANDAVLTAAVNGVSGQPSPSCGVYFSTSDTSKASIVNNALRAKSPGTVTVYADCLGDINYNTATQISKTVTITEQ